MKIKFNGSDEHELNECFTVGKVYDATPTAPGDLFGGSPGYVDVYDDNQELWLVNMHGDEDFSYV